MQKGRGSGGWTRSCPSAEPGHSQKTAWGGGTPQSKNKKLVFYVYMNQTNNSVVLLLQGPHEGCWPSGSGILYFIDQVDRVGSCELTLGLLPLPPHPHCCGPPSTQ